jgi:hypothetical protein
MAEQMISKEDARELGFAIKEMVNDLESRGFERSHVGAAMAGVGLALVQVHDGHRAAIAIVNATRDALMADVGYPQS